MSQQPSQLQAWTPGPLVSGMDAEQFDLVLRHAVDLLQDKHPQTAAVVAEARRRLASASALYEALRRAGPWLGKLIADGAHLNSVLPNDAVGALAQAEAALALAEKGAQPRG